MRRSSFLPSASTVICVLGWSRDSNQFETDCLLIPSLDLADVARIEGEWITLEVEPGSARRRRLDRYRVPLLSLGQTLVAMLA
ncbi:MAG TPA: hypothetical protein VN965_03450 [Candidatus Dormibacteraeota bacterium]|nr:hypothetical protein [Candidatus Dormibacteraeota bacterium]